MKRFEFKVALHILIIFLLSIGSCLLYQRQLWFSTTVCILFLIGAGMHLYRIQFKQITLLRRFTDGLRYNDMTQNLHPPFKNKMMDEWAQELSNALKDFRGKLLAEEVKHQYYESLLNKVDTVVLVTDASGHIEWMNQAAVAHLGQISQLPDVLQEASISNDMSMIRIEQNGIVLEMAISCTTFATQGKKQRLISLKNIHSVLERNEMEAWQKLIRVLTHEIMNSIAPVVSLSGTLLSYFRTKDAPKSSGEITDATIRKTIRGLDTIKSQGQTLMHFTESYRQFAYLKQPEPEPFPLTYLLQNLQTLYLPDMQRQHIDFSLVLFQPEITVHADEKLLSQVLINLLKNAMQALEGQADGKIRMEVDTEKNQLLIRVTDNGPGVPSDLIEDIFVPFFTTKATGSGIGLSLSRQIIRMHGGELSVASLPYRETCFTVSLPVKP